MRTAEEYMDEIMHLEDERCVVLNSETVHEGRLNLLDSKLSLLRKELREVDTSTVPEYDMFQL